MRPGVNSARRKHSMTPPMCTSNVAPAASACGASAPAPSPSPPPPAPPRFVSLTARPAAETSLAPLAVGADFLRPLSFGFVCPSPTAFRFLHHAHLIRPNSAGRGPAGTGAAHLRRHLSSLAAPDCAGITGRVSSPQIGVVNRLLNGEAGASNCASPRSNRFS